MRVQWQALGCSCFVFRLTGCWSGTCNGAIFRLNCFYFGKPLSLLLTPSTDRIKSTIYWFKCWLHLRKYVSKWACQRTTIWKKCTILWSMLPRATGIEYLCYLFYTHDLGRENKIDNFFFPHLIMSRVLVHAGCYCKMPEAGWFINHVIYHSSGG